MKKIAAILIFSILVLSGYSQYSMLSTLYQNYVQYNNYLTNGSTVNAINSQKRLDRGQSLLLSYIAGSLTGRSGLMDSSITAFNTLYGKSHTAPEISISALSNLRVDSISFDDGVTWYTEDDILTTEEIQALIDATGVDSTVVNNLIAAASIDSTFLNDHLQTFRDSLDVTSDISDSVRAWIADSTLLESEIVTLIINNSINRDTFDTEIQDIWDTATFTYPSDVAAQIEDSLDVFTGGGVGDSSWVSINVSDSVVIDDVILMNPVNGAFLISYKSGGTSLYIQNGTIYTTGGATLDFSGKIFLPDGTGDNNTGYTWISADKLGLRAGDQSTFTSEYNSGLSTIINDLKDSAVVTGLEAVRIHVDSIETNNGYHKNLMSFRSVPSANSVRYITPSGDQDFAELEAIYSSTTVTDSTTSVNISSANVVYVNDAEDCAIFGFSGGSTGDIIHVINISTNNLILKDNSTGTQKIMNGADVTITGYGGATLLYNGTYWFIIGKNE